MIRSPTIMQTDQEKTVREQRFEWPLERWLGGLEHVLALQREDTFESQHPYGTILLKIEREIESHSPHFTCVRSSVRSLVLLREIKKKKQNEKVSLSSAGQT